MRRLLPLVLVIVVAPALGAEPKAGDVMYAPPGGFPLPGGGLPLANSVKGAEQVAKTFREKEQEKFAKLGQLSEAEGWPYLRAGTKVKVVGKPEGNVFPVEVTNGIHKGATGYVATDMMGARLLEPKKLSNRPEDVRKKVFARYFELMTEAFQEARKANPGAKFYAIEEAALLALAGKMDREGKALGVPFEEWPTILIQGLVDGWKAEWSEK